jgi:hypothetical protein
MSTARSRAAEVLSRINSVLVVAGLNDNVWSVRDCDSTLFVLLFKKLFGKLPGVIASPVSAAQHARNFEVVLRAVASDVLSMDLGHISPDALARGDLQALYNLAEIFSELCEVLLKREDENGGRPATMHAGGSAARPASARPAGASAARPSSARPTGNVESGTPHAINADDDDDDDDVEEAGGSVARPASARPAGASAARPSSARPTGNVESGTPHAINADDDDDDDDVEEAGGSVARPASARPAGASAARPSSARPTGNVESGTPHAIDADDDDDDDENEPGTASPNREQLGVPPRRAAARAGSLESPPLATAAVRSEVNRLEDELARLEGQRDPAAPAVARGQSPRHKSGSPTPAADAIRGITPEAKAERTAAAARAARATAARIAAARPRAATARRRTVAAAAAPPRAASARAAVRDPADAPAAAARAAAASRAARYVSGLERGVVTAAARRGGAQGGAGRGGARPASAPASRPAPARLGGADARRTSRRQAEKAARLAALQRLEQKLLRQVQP